MPSLASKIHAATDTLLVQAKHESIGAFFASDYYVHRTDHVVTGGHQIVRRFLELYRGAFPDLKADIEVLLEGPERISWQRTMRATHHGAFKGFPASGMSIMWRDVVTSRFRDGLIAEEWMISDLAEQLLLSRKKKK